QSPALARRETDGLVLLWRRDVLERVARLAPFASFDDAVPVVVDSALWWVAYGYFEAEAFPLARPVAGGDRDSVRYLRAGLVGAPSTTAPGVPRLWNVAGGLFFEQALFRQPATGGPPTGIDTVFLSWREHRGQGRSVAAALRSLLASGGDAHGPADTALAARWRRAQQLAAQADAALAAGDLERFGQLYAQLKELLGLGRRKLAPAPERR